MNLRKYFPAVALTGLVLSFAFVTAADAATKPTPGAGRGEYRGMMYGRGSGIVGIVTAINGTTITVTAKGGPDVSEGTSYTIDAANATFVKNGAASTIGDIAVNDVIVARGTLNGTTVTATSIRDGVSDKGGMMYGLDAKMIQGNGQPLVGGTVTALNGNSFTMTNAGNVTYTVDAASATIQKGGVTSTVANIAVNDKVLVQGTVNGTSVVATSVIDQGSATLPATAGVKPPHRGFLGAIGSFFLRLFKFF